MGRLWRGTNAGLALAVPMVCMLFYFALVCFGLDYGFSESHRVSSAQVGIYLPFYDMFRNKLEDLSRENAPATTIFVPLVAGALARSLACTVCYPIELARTRMQVL